MNKPVESKLMVGISFVLVCTGDYGTKEITVNGSIPFDAMSDEQAKQLSEVKDDDMGE